jgi:hypothetical protein
MSDFDPFDPSSLRLDESIATATGPACSATQRPPRHRRGEWFLREPIPWPWLEIAARLPGKALAVGLCLWWKAGRRGRRTVKVCQERVGLGVSEQAARRGLRQLAKAGLVTIDQLPGRGLEVTINEAPGGGPDPEADGRDP